MVASEKTSSWVPPWVKTLGLAVWISGPDRSIVFVNERAASLLGRPASELIGRPCHEAVGGKDESGESFCSERCAIYLDATSSREIEPVRILLDGADGHGHWVQILPICVHSPDFSGPWLVHCVLTEDKTHRLERYLTKIASRTMHADETTPSPSQFTLTRREEQILDLLAEDQTLHAIASELGLSYTTVRNHVQHILTKLGVHSIMEAVAYHLLAKD
jgi:DNA-binding CsgD family transcriptional regulator